MGTMDYLLIIFCVIILFLMVFIWYGCRVGKVLSDVADSMDETHEQFGEPFTEQRVNESKAELQALIDEAESKENLNKAIADNELRRLDAKPKRSRSRRKDFSMETAIEDGKAIYVNGKSHTIAEYTAEHGCYYFNVGKYKHLAAFFHNGTHYRENDKYLVNIKKKP